MNEMNMEHHYKCSLLLFDIDETLLIGSALVHFHSLETAFRVSLGVDVEIDTKAMLGLTDRQIVNTVLTQAGFQTPIRQSDQLRLEEQWALAMRQELEKGTSMRPREDIETVLLALRGHGWIKTVVSGNLETLARMKLSAANIVDELDLDVGAFGSDAEARSELPGIAVRKAQAKNPSTRLNKTVVIGDTPRDIEAAHASGFPCIAIDTPSFSRHDLSGAEHWVESSEDLLTVLQTEYRSSL